MPINDRILNLISALDSNPNSFADTIGVKNTVIYNIVKGRRSKPSFEVLQKILQTYKALNANWLLKGDGNLWNDKQQKIPDVKLEITLGERLESLLNKLRNSVGENGDFDELIELVNVLIAENQSQKVKIEGLYKKQKKILQTIKSQMGLDI